MLNVVDQTQKTLRTSPEGVKNRDELKPSVTGTLSFMSKIIRHIKVTKIIYFVEYAVFIFIHAQMLCISAPKTNKTVTQGPTNCYPEWATDVWLSQRPLPVLGSGFGPQHQLTPGSQRPGWNFCQVWLCNTERALRGLVSYTEALDLSQTVQMSAIRAPNIFELLIYLNNAVKLSVSNTIVTIWRS